MSTYCERCRRRMEEGEVQYLITIHATADFDNTLPDRGGIEDLEAFMRMIDRKDPEELEHDIYESKGFVLCPSCKKAYMKNPLATPAPEDAGPLDIDDDEEGRLH